MNYSNYAMRYIGVKEYSKKHKYIINEYNKIIPLPRNYKVKYSDAWCATFVSFVLNKCNSVDTVYECSASKMYAKCKKENYLVNPENVKVNDIVFYDWYDDNSVNHVGIICKIQDTLIKVIEGNKSDKVGYRTISKFNRYIEGFARIPKKNHNYDSIVNDVINGKYGNGSKRRKALTELGYDYTLIQKLVNAKLRG